MESLVESDVCTRRKAVVCGLAASLRFDRLVRRTSSPSRPLIHLYALPDGLEVRRTPCPTDWKSVVRAVRRTSSPSAPKIALYDSTWWKHRRAADRLAELREGSIGSFALGDPFGPYLGGLRGL